MSDAVELRRYTGAEVAADRALRVVLAGVYAEVFAEPPYEDPPERATEWADGALVRHAALPGFVLVAAVSAGDVLGFGYGSIDAEDSWFASYVREHAPGAVWQTWLGGHGALAELAVLARARGRGIGGRLHDAVVEHLRSAGATRLILLTQAAAVDARALYARRGWVDLAELSPGNRLMGLEVSPTP